MTFTVERFDGESFGPFLSERHAEWGAGKVLEDWVPDEGGVTSWLTDDDCILVTVTTSNGEETEAHAFIVPDDAPVCRVYPCTDGETCGYVHLKEDES